MYLLDFLIFRYILDLNYLLEGKIKDFNIEYVFIFLYRCNWLLKEINK